MREVAPDQHAELTRAVIPPSLGGRTLQLNCLVSTLIMNKVKCADPTDNGSTNLQIPGLILHGNSHTLDVVFYQTVHKRHTEQVVPAKLPEYMQWLTSKVTFRVCAETLCP